MSSDKQLTKLTNQWFVMFLITAAIGTGFYWYKTIIVTKLGEIQFSQYLEDFNVNVAGFMDTIRPNTYYDFLFILAYSFLFYLAYRVFQSSMRIPVSKLWVFLCFVPGIFDVVENIILLNLLNHPDNNWLFNSFWLIVRAKWTVIIPFILINVTILVYYFLRIVNSFFS